MPKSVSAITILATILLLQTTVAAQPSSHVSALIAEGDSLHRSYRFLDALGAYNDALQILGDSLSSSGLDRRIVQTQNAIRMTGYCSTPTVIARERFHISSFFLYYPLPDRSWRPLPNPLDSTSTDPVAQAMFAPEGAGKIIYTASGPDGRRSIHMTSRGDTVWTAPTLLTPSALSGGSEIFPMLSPDGNTLIFASNGLYGMGGYDIYTSTFDPATGDWSAPVNPGFPFNSPADDFLLVNTPDSRYTIFASNRDCPADSVDIYVLEYDPMPVRKSITNPEELSTLQRLTPLRDPSRFDNSSALESMPDNDATQLYMRQMGTVRSIRDAISSTEKKIADQRARLSTADADTRTVITHEISGLESGIPALRDSLSRERKKMQQLEMQFLRDGIVFDLDRLQQTADREVVGAGEGYTFIRRSMGSPLHIKTDKKIESEGSEERK